MYNAVETQTFSNISATTSAFTLKGGNYGVMVNATFGGGNVALQRLSVDGSTWVTCVLAFTAQDYQNANLPSGSYRFSVTTATAVYAEVTSIVVTP